MGPRLIESIWFGCDPVFARVFERFSPIITIRHCRTSSIGASSPSSPRVMPMSSSPGSVPQIGESCAKTYKEWRPCFSITGNRFSATLSTAPRSPFAPFANGRSISRLRSRRLRRVRSRHPLAIKTDLIKTIQSLKSQIKQKETRLVRKSLERALKEEELESEL